MRLHEIGLKYGTDKATHHGYCDFYEKELEGLNPKRILEIGVKDGASLRMWKDFYPDAEIIGVDIKPIHVPGCFVYPMNQSDIYIIWKLGNFDLIIDDGSHMTLDQQISFYHLFQHQLNDGGIYIIEDIHTSFYKEYVNTEFTTYELIMKFLPQINKKLFQRIPGNTSDSNTLLIRK